jgi:4-hydroxy-tetrahydrodipicolinate reductase
MGKPLENCIKERGHELVHTVDHFRTELVTENIDVYIDFSAPEALRKHLPLVAEARIPLVIGTTGWSEELQAFDKLLHKHRSGAIWSNNFSIGVNIFWRILEKAQQQVQSFEKEYDVHLHEQHHRFKKDAPSGTAINTAAIVLDGSSTKKKMRFDSAQRANEEGELHVSSSRGGHHPGTHSVMWDSVFDTIELKHTARTRDGFALGAVMAAEFVVGKHLRGLVSFSDIFDELKLK